MTRSGSWGFAEPAVLILVSLSDGPKHGYAIANDVEGVIISMIPFAAGGIAGATIRLGVRRSGMSAPPR